MALFFNPLVNVFSAYPDNYGISSRLVDDIDFAEQPLASHLERARHTGIKYLAIVTPRIKERLSHEPEVAERHEVGLWSVFVLKQNPLPRMRALPFRPALVVSSFSLKQRRSNEYDFVRLAEEQFADNWFEVLLVRSPERKIDRLLQLDQFGALILDTYESDDEERAFERLQEFAQHRPLILLSSDASLFHRIQTAISDFPLAKVVNRVRDGSGEWLKSAAPTSRYASNPVRKEWDTIQQILDAQKVATNSEAEMAFSAEVKQNTISVRPTASTIASVPVLIGTTYHPSWQREDGEAVYATTPFFMLTFVRKPTQLIFARGWFEWAGLAVSAIMLLIVCCSVAWYYRKRLMWTM